MGDRIALMGDRIALVGDRIALVEQGRERTLKGLLRK